MHVIDPYKHWSGLVPSEQYTTMHVWMWRRLEVLETATQKFVKLPAKSIVFSTYRNSGYQTYGRYVQEEKLTTKISTCQHCYN